MRKAYLSILLFAFMATEASALSTTMVASWYEHGKVTANGEKYNPDGLTVAHKTLPFGTKLKLTRNGKSIIVRVNDRGPFIDGREIDLSRGAAKALDCYHVGICKVQVERVK